MARIRSWLYAILAVAAVGWGLTACEPWATTQSGIEYQQCQWDVGCQPRCAQGYEGRMPYCGHD